MTRPGKSVTASVDRVDLYLASYKDFEWRLLEQHRRLLSEEERNGESRFRFTRDRHRYVVTRALVRSVLSQYAPIPPTAWRFGKNVYGRPEVANEGEAERTLSFNVSHASDLILMGVTRQSPVGVDIETVDPAAASLEIADCFFATEEVAALRALRSDARPKRFFQYWTLKESYIKARGMGLSIPLNSFAFDLSDGAEVGLSFREPSADIGANWRFWQLQLLPGYVAAVCVRRRVGGRETLSLRQIATPSSDEDVFSFKKAIAANRAISCRPSGRRPQGWARKTAGA